MILYLLLFTDDVVILLVYLWEKYRTVK